jgi:hypothetical protein
MKKKIVGLAVLSLSVLFLSGCASKSIGNQDQKIAPGENQTQDRGTKDASTDKKQASLPAEALSACQGKSEGDGCEMTMPQNSNGSATVSATKAAGTCKKASDSQLACMPQGGAGGPGGQKPDANK